MASFPHMNDTAFPDVDGVNTYKYENDFDYRKYDTRQMRITVCSVPWDVGLIHVGNAQVGGLGNVVKFEDKAARDAWFDSIEDKFTWETKYRAYHTDGYIEVPLPYEKCVLYNYVYVEYDLLPVEYAHGGKEAFHFFIRECESLAPNNCKVKILRDTWQDYIYDIHIAHMMLERGHAAIANSDVSEYLANPLLNTEWLLAEDVNFGSTYKTKNVSETVLNSQNMLAVVVSASDWQGRTGTKHQTGWRTPDGRAMTDGQPSRWAYSVTPDRLDDLLQAIETNAPQLLQSVECVFFVSSDYVTLRRPFEFHGETVSRVVQGGADVDLLALNASQFGYDEKYAHLAKLYTFPYSYIEIADDGGNVSQLKVEETSGELSLHLTSSLAYPWLSLDGNVSGVGAGGTKTVTFRNVNLHTFEFGGSWYENLHRWAIPTFGIEVAASVAYDYETHFDRVQKRLEADTNLANALRANATAYQDGIDNAATAKTNADNAANTEKSNADNAANTEKSNADAAASAAYTNQANNIARFRDNTSDEAMLQTRVKNANNKLIKDETEVERVKLSSDAIADIACSMAVEGAENEATAVTAGFNAASGIVGNAAMGAITGSAAGSIVPGMGTVAGAAVGAIGGAAAGIVDAGHIGFTSMVSMTTNSALAEATRNTTRNKVQAAATANASIRDLRTGHNDSVNALTQQYVGQIANRNRDTDNAANTLSKNTTVSMNAATRNTAIANNAATRNTAIANNANQYDTAAAITARDKQTDDANAQAVYDAELQAIENEKAQAALNRPLAFGEFSSGETSTTRPIGLFVNVVTQSDDSIAQAGDYFLRFGYACNKAVEFEDFNLMPRFTYWKASDIWVKGNNVPDAYMDEIRFFLLGGVCVWRNPEDIGNTSIYENR